MDQPVFTDGQRVRTLIHLTCAHWDPQQPDIPAGSLGTVDAIHYRHDLPTVPSGYHVMLDDSVQRLSAWMDPQHIEAADQPAVPPRGPRTLRVVQLRGWTLALTTGPGHLHATLTRPSPLDPVRREGLLPALELNLSAHLTDPHCPTPLPVHDPLRLRVLRLWQRWAYRHPEAPYQPDVLTVGPWAIGAHRLGLLVERLPEFDCPWHEPLDDEPDCEPQACTCPRIRPRLEASLTRPERHPEEAPL